MYLDFLISRSWFREVDFSLYAINVASKEREWLRLGLLKGNLGSARSIHATGNHASLLIGFV